MAVGVVACDATSQPDHVAGPQVIGEDALDVRAAEPGVAGLNLAEQALLGRQDRAAAIHVDRAALHHDPDPMPPLLYPRYPPRQSQPFRQPARQAAVVVVILVLRPGVEFPLDQADAARRARFVTLILDGISRRALVIPHDERRSRVAEPDAVRGRLEEPDSIDVDPGGVKPVGCPALHRTVADHDVNGLGPAEHANDLGVHPRDRSELTGPVLAVMRPGNPGRRMRLPLRGHLETKLGGGRFHGFSLEGMAGMRADDGSDSLRASTG